MFCLHALLCQVHHRRRCSQRRLQRVGVQARRQRSFPTGAQRRRRLRRQCVMMQRLRCACVLLTFVTHVTQAMESAGAKILEPVMKVEVSGPEEYQGVLVASINRRKGIIQVRLFERFIFLSDIWRAFLDSGHNERQRLRHRCLRSGTQQHVWIQHRSEKQHPGTSPAIIHHFSRHNSRGSSALSNIESAAAHVTAP